MSEGLANEHQLLCDYCSDATAVIYCRADTARLCVPCDRQVHGANALSSKHVRAQICDKCGDTAAATRCSTEKLCLCNDCDFAAHSGVETHRRVAIEGFSGFPSVVELAALWGIELDVFGGLSGMESVFGDLYVPCLKRKRDVVRQLEEMARRDCGLVMMGGEECGDVKEGDLGWGCGSGDHASQVLFWFMLVFVGFEFRV